MVFPNRMENALPRAEELLAVNQQSAALQLLYDAITSRHFQHNLLALEPIVNKFVELCVELRQGRFVKDGLLQYRSFSQNTNMQAFEQAVRKFVVLSERRLEEAIRNSDETSTTIASATDDDPAVEEIAKMLQAQLSMDTGKTAVDRQTVLPWMRFMWEALRAALEVCRNNQKLERLYFELVCKSFDYCQKYQRKSELKRLAETLRHHLISILKASNHAQPQPMSIVLTGESANADSQQIQLDIRYRQLDVALEMELWQEAFRSIEDIHGLFLLGGKSAEQLLEREEYFEKVARIFAMSENTLFYSAALIRRLQAFSLDHSSAALKESIVRSIIASVLSVPLGSSPVTESVFNNGSWSFLEDQHSRHTRLAYFLGLDSAPTLPSILGQILEMNIVKDAQMVDLLTVYTRLDFVKCSWQFVQEMWTFLMNNVCEAERFSTAIASNLVYLHLKHLELSNQSFSLADLESKCIQLFQQPINVLLLLTKWTRSNDIAVFIDQSSGQVQFNQKASLLNDPSGCAFLDYDDTKTVYMHRLCSLLQARSESAFGSCKALFEKLEAVKRESIKRQEAADRQREERELARKEREREEAKERMARLAAEEEAEERRLLEEAAQRERERVKREREQVRKAEQKKKEEEERRLAELSGMRANLERLQLLAVRLDHIERAIRHEELPLLEADYKQQLVEDRNSYERHVAAVKEESLRAYTADRRALEIIEPSKPDIDSFLLKLKQVKLAARDAKQQELNQQFEKAKRERIERMAREKEMLKAKPAESLASAITSALAPEPAKYIPPSQRASASTEGAWRRETTSTPAANPIPKPAETAKYIPPHLKNRH